MKFFLFRREEINEGSVKSSDSGIGLSVFAIPAEQMGFMTAVKGFINITFNNAGLYETTALIEGESFEKTNVSISCVEGEELELMEDILNFVTSDAPKKKIMKFDVVTGKSSFDSAISKSVSDISTQVKINPIVMTSGDISRGDPAKEFQDTIGEIYFGADKPSLDFNHEGLADYADGVEITAWANAGTGGSTYSIAANVGDPLNTTSLSAARGLAKTSATIALDDYFVVPNAYTVSEDYTAYMVFRVTTSALGLGVLYGDDSGDTMGFCFGDMVYDSSGGIDKAEQTLSTFKVRHDGRSGEPASVSTASDQGGTVKHSFPEIIVNPENGETCQVFIVRRDKQSNMYLHNRTGDLVAFIPGFTQLMTPSGKHTNMAGMTDGNLLIEQIGSGGGIIATSGRSLSFTGSLARFGVIEKDIGTSKSGQLAQDLFNLYNF